MKQAERDASVKDIDSGTTRLHAGTELLALSTSVQAPLIINLRLPSKIEFYAPRIAGHLSPGGTVINFIGKKDRCMLASFERAFVA